VEDLDDALYERRSLVRMLGMRRTLFVVPRGTAAEMDAGCTKALAAGERRRLVKMLVEQGVADGDALAWLEDVCARTTPRSTLAEPRAPRRSRGTSPSSR
jgi:hypothetical protein